MSDGRELTTQPLATESAGRTAWHVGGRYRVEERLGSGATAEVFRAHDEVLGREVAVKVFRTVLLDDPDGHGAERRSLEMQALARMSHPNLVTMYDGSVLPDAQPYLVLELVPGVDLATRLRSGPLSEQQARVLGIQVASALAYAHDRGMVHRDVKPANILLGTDGPDGELRARLSDFGTVRLIDMAPLTAGDLTLGTASYLAPEQARGADVGPEADVYSLGLVLIEALTGTRCFDGAAHELLASRLTAAAPIPDGLPRPWPALLASMTALDPAHRPSAAQVADCLRTGASLPEPVATALLPAVARRNRRHSGGLGVFALGSVACTGLLAGAAYVASGHDGSTPGKPPPSPHASATRGHAQAVTTHRSSSAPALVAPTRAASTSAHRSRTVAPAQVAVPSATVASSVTTSAAPSASASTSSAPSSSPVTTPPTSGTPTPPPTTG